MFSISSGVSMPIKGSASGCFWSNEGTSRGRPATMSSTAFLPLWTSCSASFAPWAWTRSLMRRQPSSKVASPIALWRGVESPSGAVTPTEPTRRSAAPPRALASK